MGQTGKSVKNLTQRSRRLPRRVGYAAAIAVAAVAIPLSGSEAIGWNGMEVQPLASVVSNGTAPAWALGITEDLGGPGVDVWNNNHGALSEAIIDVTSDTENVQNATRFQSA